MFYFFVCKLTIFKCLGIIVANNFPLAIILRILSGFNRKSRTVFSDRKVCFSIFGKG